MVVKAKRGRRRYIAFTVDEGMSRSTLISRLQSLAGEDAPYVVQCAEGWAIVRTDPKGCDTAIGFMKNADPSCASLSASGTLRTLRQRYPRLQETKPPSKKH